MSSGQPISGHRGRDQWICAILTHHDLMTPLELRVAVRLGIFFNCKTGQCDPGYARLAKELCISPRSARRCVAALVSYGLVGRDEGAGGSHDQKQNFSLFMPVRGTDSMSPVRRTASVSPVETEQPDRHGGQKHGGTGDQNRVGRGTIRRPTKEPDEPEEPDSSAVPAERTTDAVRESASNSTSQDASLPATDGPVPRTAHAALKQPLAEQEQPPPGRATSKKMGRPVNADADPAFAEVYQRGREVLGDDADAVITELLAAHDGYAECALDTLAVADEESDPRQYIEKDIEAARRTGRQ
ncbi:helix-turn-helix domain-containing protein [Bradyrhizobium barranii subsp. apii]|uniref:Helix-turn-helix domain-containing protein n=1 Tax=Bradyrhizobium barranii subsp. apii TaxID=2819348 RepID=A0A8T5V3Q3_9BRAD|nr:hypothetical protein [Bradyrhizobium barranii]UPT87967.1 helix-turn-helix domain-containing protein [Bradyrhizobium barranii subsp. apii]